MVSKNNRVVPISALKATELPSKPATYARLDELLEARRHAHEALEFITAPGTTGEYLKLLDEGQQTFLRSLENVCVRLEAMLFFDQQCDGCRISSENVSFLEYVLSTVGAFCEVANSFTVARNIKALQIDNANDGWRTVMEAIVSLERLARRSLSQLLMVGPEKIIPRSVRSEPPLEQ